MTDGSAAGTAGAAGHASVRVVRTADPVTEAGRLVVELGADVAGDRETVERLVRQRVEAGRRAVGGDGAGDAALLARAEAIRSAAAVEPPLADADVDELRHLAADLGRATRIKDRTEARVAEQLQARVAASTGVALHPSAILAAAQGVVVAEEVLAAAEREVLEHGAPPAGDDEVAPLEARDDPVLRRPHDDFDEAALERRRLLLRVAIALVVGGAVAGGMLAAGLPVAAAAGAGAGLFVVAAVVLVLVGRRAGAAGEGKEEAGDLLAAVGRAVADTETGRLAASMDEAAAVEAAEAHAAAAAAAAAATLDDEDSREAWVERRARLDAARDEAEELARVARNRWHQLVGPDADPYRADEVVRAHDPQLAYDQRVTLSSPTVRTVAAFHRKVTARWRILWAGMGRDEPPAADELEELLDSLLGESRRARADLAALEEAETRTAAVAEVRRPIVVVEPAGWVEPTRLSQLLASIPPEGSVVVLERTTDAADAAEPAAEEPAS